MNWTRKAPTVAGWYWWRRDQHALPGVAIACSDLSGYYMSRTGHNSTFDHVDDVIGRMACPSPRRQSAGAGGGVEEACGTMEMVRSIRLTGSALLSIKRSRHQARVGMAIRTKRMLWDTNS